MEWLQMVYYILIPVFGLVILLNPLNFNLWPIFGTILLIIRMFL